MTTFRRCAPPFSWLICLLCLVGFAGTAHAARLAKVRMIPAESIARISSLNALVVTPQQSPAVLVLDPRMGMGPNVSVALASNPGITGGTFAGGAAAGVAGVLIGSAVVDAQWQSLRDEVQGLLHAVDGGAAWDAEHAQWNGMLKEGLSSDAGVAAEVDVVDTASTDSAARWSACAAGDGCLVALSRWGLSADARQLEVHVQLMIWSPELRKAGKKPRQFPDYTNQLIYRSAPLELPAEKTDQDRELLRAAAKRLYRTQGVSDLVKIANDKRNPDSRDARKKVNLLLRQDRARMKEANRANWTDEAFAIRRALIWGDAEGQRIRDELRRASEEIAGMLTLELSPEGQAAKTTGRFKGRDAHAVAKVMRSGAREWVYLNEGALVSRISGDQPSLPWNHALELRTLVEQR